MSESSLQSPAVASDRGSRATTGSGQPPERGIGSRPRIGIFQSDWVLQVHTVNSALVLAESGFCVDLFLYRVSEDYVKGALDDVKGVRVMRWGEERRNPWGPDPTATEKPTPSRREVVRRTVSRIGPPASLWRLARASRAAFKESYARCYPAWLDRRKGQMPGWLVRETLLAMGGLRYKALIGMEKAGLVWAGQVAERTHVPYLYHSLELYTREHPGSAMTVRKKCLKHAEERYHRRSFATIIQDRARAEILFADNRVKPERVLYVPVSLLGQPRPSRSSFLQKRHGIGGDRALVLEFGTMMSWRLSTELVQLAQRFPDKWTLVIHGPPPGPERLQQIRAADIGRRVVFSMDQVPASQLDEVVGSAHVGLALYRSTMLTDRLTVFSSEKVARYLKCGVPVIAFDYPGFEILEHKRCGSVIASLDDLPAAIGRVLASWDEFSDNARELFAEHYEFRTNYQKVIDFLDSIPGAGPSPHNPVFGGRPTVNHASRADRR